MICINSSSSSITSVGKAIHKLKFYKQNLFFCFSGESESDLDQEDTSVDALSSLGTEAIEQLASGLNLAANTIEGYSQNVSQRGDWVMEFCENKFKLLLSVPCHSLAFLNIPQSSIAFLSILQLCVSWCPLVLLSAP